MRRNFTQLYMHLVWATWDRLPLITPNIKEQIYNVISYECNQLGCSVVAIGGIEDHAHLLAGFPANVAISDLVKQIKGSSSHCVMNQMQPNTVRIAHIPCTQPPQPPNSRPQGHKKGGRNPKSRDISPRIGYGVHTSLKNIKILHSIPLAPLKKGGSTHIPSLLPPF